jgi:hypothetical protein
MQLALDALRDAWQVLRQNWIVVWFPVLMAIGSGIVLVIVAVALLLGLDPTIQSRLLAGDFSSLAGLWRQFSLAGMAAFALVAFHLSGQANMLAAAIKGEPVDTGHFAAGVRRYFWTFIGGSALLGLAQIVLAVILWGNVFHQLLTLAIAYGTTADLITLIQHFSHLLSRVMIGGFLLSTLRFFFGLWNKIAPLEECGAVPAVLASPRVVWRNLSGFLLLALLSLAVNGVLLETGNDSGLGGLLYGILGVIWSTYYQLALFAAYWRASGRAQPDAPDYSRRQPPEEPEPPLLLI